MRKKDNVVTVLGFQNLLPRALTLATMLVLKPLILGLLYQIFNMYAAMPVLIRGSAADIYMYFIGSHMNCILKA